jgi:hypothetical protein
MIIQTSSWRAGVIGEAQEDNKSDRFFGDFVLDVAKSTGTTIDHLLTIRSKATFQSKSNHVRTRVQILVSTNNTTQDVIFKAYRLADVTFAAGPTFADFSTANSVIEIAKDTTTLTEVNPASDVALILKGGQRPNTDIQGLDIYTGESIVFGVQASLTATGTVSFQINWVEEF